SKCSSAETSVPSGWLPCVGCSSCCGSPSKTSVLHACDTASTLASAICAASSTKSTSTHSDAASRDQNHAVPAATWHCELLIASSDVALSVVKVRRGQSSSGSLTF